MAVLDFLRKRHLHGSKVAKTRKLANKTARGRDEPKESADMKENPQSTHAVTLDILAQAGAYIPFQGYYDLCATLLITALSAAVRMYRIDYPPQVV
jgi:hypothetical protein